MKLIVLVKNRRNKKYKKWIQFSNFWTELVDNQKLIFHLEEEKEEEDSILCGGNLEKIKEKNFVKLPIIRINLSNKNTPVLIKIFQRKE